MAIHHDPELWRLWNLIAERARDLHQVLVLDDPRPPPRSRSGHSHHIPTLLLPLRGGAQVQSRAGRIDLAPGQALVIAPATWHEHRPLRGDSAALHQGFMAQHSDVSLLRRGSWLSGRAPQHPYRQTLARVCTLKNPSDRSEAVRNALQQLVEEAITPFAPPHPAVQRMCRCLWWQYHLGISAADVIAASGCSQAQAYRLFVAFFGQPPKQELLDMRLQTAQHLLERGMAVGEVSERCGFTCRAACTRAFRKYFGRPPTSQKVLENQGPHLSK